MLFRKKQVYISSTFVDLTEHRSALKQAIEPAGFEVEHMERYAAFDERPTAKCLKDVRACDYYILILARRYGFIPDEGKSAQLSITRLEYLEAAKHGKPRFVFLLDPSAPWPVAVTDADYSDPSSQIFRFRSEVGVAHGISLFVSPNELSQKVLQALSSHATNASRRRRALALRVATGLFALGVLGALIVEPEDPSVTANDWLRAVAASQERKLLSIAPSAGGIDTGRLESIYLSKMSSDASAWLRFADAYALSSNLIKKHALQYENRSLKRDLESGNLAGIVRALLELPINSAREAAERFYLVGAFLELDGSFFEAFGSYEKAVVSEPLNSKYATAALNLATNTGQIKEAIALAGSQRRELSRQINRPDDLATVIGYEALARWFNGESEASRSLFEEAITLSKALPTRARLMNDRVPLFNEVGDLAGAEQTLTEAAYLYRCSGEQPQHGLIASILNLVATLTRQGRIEEAEKYIQYASDLLSSENYSKNPFPVSRAQQYVVMGLLELARGDNTAAELSFRNALAMFSKLRIDSSFLASRARQYLGRALLRKGDVKGSIPEFVTAIEQNVRLFGADHSETITARIYLAESYLANDRITLAASELNIANEFVRANGNKNWRFSGKLDMLLGLYDVRTLSSMPASKHSRLEAAGLEKIERGCRSLATSAQVIGEWPECWRAAIKVSGNPDERVARFSDELAAAEQTIIDRRVQRDSFFGVWSRPCPK